MKIYSISRLLSLPLILAVGYFLYLLFQPGSENTVFIFVPVVLLVTLYIFHGQLDFWWLKKNTPELDPKIKAWLKEYLPYYNAYTAAEKQEFEKRLVLYVEARSFQSVGSKELRAVPFDIKNIISTQVVRLMLGQEDFLLGDMDRIYLYKHPFPTPNQPFLHTVETDVEDGVLIFSTEQGLPGIVNPSMYYNIILHGYIEAFLSMKSSFQFTQIDQIGWEKLEQIEGINANLIQRTCGTPKIDLRVVNLVAFFEFSEQYLRLFPEAYRECRAITKQNPANHEPRF